MVGSRRPASRQGDDDELTRLAVIGGEEEGRDAEAMEDERIEEVIRREEKIDEKVAA